MGTARIEFDDLSIDIGSKDKPCDVGMFQGRAEIVDGYVDAIWLKPETTDQVARRLDAENWLFDKIAKAVHYAYADAIDATVPSIEKPDRDEHGTYWGKP
jgi:hypothetical protein